MFNGDLDTETHVKVGKLEIRPLLIADNDTDALVVRADLLEDPALDVGVSHVRCIKMIANF